MGSVEGAEGYYMVQMIVDVGNLSIFFGSINPQNETP